MSRIIKENPNQDKNENEKVRKPNTNLRETSPTKYKTQERESQALKQGRRIEYLSQRKQI